MKKFRLIFLLLTLLTFGLNSCQKPIVFVEGSGPGGSEFATATIFKAKVDGVLLECAGPIKGVLIPDASTSSTSLQITANKGNEGFTISLVNYTGIGTYTLGSNLDLVAYVKDLQGDATISTFFATSGTIRITSVSSKAIKGTFEFNGENGIGEIKTITSGEFFVSL